MESYTRREMQSELSDEPAIKVLYAIDCLVPGGTALQLVGFIDCLDRERFKPTLLTIRPTQAELAPIDCQHLTWDVPRLLSPGGAHAVRRLARYLHRERIKVVHTIFQDSTFVAGLAARLAGVPVRLTSFRDRGFWRTRGQEMLLRRIYPLMTGFMCIAESVRQHAVARDRIDSSKIAVVRNGIDIASTRWADRPGPVRRIGIVGNLTRPIKRTDLFLEAAAHVMTKHPEISFHIIGDGHLKHELEELAQTLGVAGRVVFSGRITDVSAFLETLDIGVICSDSEGLSNAILEYMLAWVVTVATAVGGNTELVIDGETGLLVPSGNPGALAEAIMRLIDAPLLRSELSYNARRRVETSYSWDRCLADHTEFYARQLAAAKEF